MDNLREEPLQGVELTSGIRKIRMALKSKGRGKSGGARVITYNIIAEQQNGVIVLLLIYDKADYSSVDVDILKDNVRAEGYDLE